MEYESLQQFIQAQLDGAWSKSAPSLGLVPAVVYEYIASDEGKQRVNRAFDRLFAELVHRRRAAGDGDITGA
ncbi:hypothetical protein A3C18_01070 [Candidatus Kaiserbacteria bacterium RIFCSPHIGHO2_02_FULL_54_11b]|uniref:Uncharacterized protein n=2 Tax=Candidatus Kaiseribacteriota TaxID=1752734 RepID=A0A1F6CK48_9BACT|nr:MAG: hypothetical protein A2704_04310 [Candidatus Kaiserbacteria bacterium RIFCSPHIGHO2_01_FULL_54_36b]OGG64800.1 MAG: hypothetical protein A3C18_01070 [Candidatus Kaiserbacteria bacterium RIFCSPHIGHO2_02_FULL_54_11b]